MQVYLALCRPVPSAFLDSGQISVSVLPFYRFADYRSGLIHVVVMHLGSWAA